MEGNSNLVKPPKAGPATRPPKFEDTKSQVSRVSSRASSKPKLAPAVSSGGQVILSREEEARVAKEKKDRMDSIKR